MRRTLFSLLMAILVTPFVSAQVVLTTAVPFLQIEPDSRAAGMGMSGVALADNAYAPYWNPAGLARQHGAEISFTHAPWLPALQADLSFEYLTGTYSLDSTQTLGAHLTYFNLGEQTWTDEQGQDLGTHTSYEMALGVSYGRQMTDRLALGGGARFIYSNLTGGQAVGSTDTQAGVSFGVDLGLLYTLPDFNLGGAPVTPTLGLNLANMGPTISYVADSTGGKNPIPTNLRFGGALDAQLDDYNKLRFALDFNKLLVSQGDSTEGLQGFPGSLFSSWGSHKVKTDGNVEGSCAEIEGDNDPSNDDACETVGLFDQLTLGTGLEWWYNDLFAIRTGYFYESPHNGNRTFLTFGAGIRYSLVGVDMSYVYALKENSPIADQLRFSLLLNIPR